LAGVIGPLKLSEKYNPLPVYIAKDGSWYCEPDLADIHFYTSGDVEKKLAKFKRIQLLFDDGLVLIKPGLKAEKIKVDVAFPATHGTYGEDGSLMGVFRMADVPFAGSDLIESGIAMDKLASRYIAVGAGIPVPPFVGFLAHEFEQDRAGIMAQIKKLRFPLFVKPTHLGSSIAVARVTNQQELENAVEVALHYDSAAIVEEAVQNLVEVTVPIMGNDDYRLGLVEEYLYKDDEFFDFSTKYLVGGKGGKKMGAKSGQGGGKYSRMPADLSKALYTRCEELTKQVFATIGGSGYARVDLLVDTKAKKVYFNEVNPLPGSLQNHNWKEAGVSPVQLAEDLIEFGLERFERQKGKTYTFDSNFLKQFD
jgi:D-alanine-D-alanine ligase